MSEQDERLVDDQDRARGGDKYLSAEEAIQKVLQEENFPEGPVERIEVYLHASGDVTWRVWEARADEYTGGAIVDYG